MNAFIEQNKKLLKFYYTVLRLSGWLLLALGLFSPIVLIVLAKNSDPQEMKSILLYTPLNCFTLLFLGLFGIGLAQLIRYLFDSDYKPGFVLRHGNKIIYVYVVFNVVITLFIAITNIANYVRYLSIPGNEVQLSFLSVNITSMICFIAKIIILFGVALFLKRLMPVMDESKTLV